MTETNDKIIDVSRAAIEIRNLNSQLAQELVELKRTMVDISAAWQSPAAEIILTRFNNMIPILEDYRNSIDNYADYLDTIDCNIDCNEER